MADGLLIYSCQKNDAVFNVATAAASFDPAAAGEGCGGGDGGGGGGCLPHLGSHQLAGESNESDVEQYNSLSTSAC